jgi:YjbE family integral membrane protein
LNAIVLLLDPSGWPAVLTSGWYDLGPTQFWLAIGKIIWIDILLSGDNAVVIALACRGLPPRQRVWGMVLGAGAAVTLRIIFTAIVASLMLLPYVKIVGGTALLYIAAKLLVPDPPSHGGVATGEQLWRAVRIVAVADAVMSLDNVIAIAAVAQGHIALLVFGLVVSIPLIVAGAALIMLLLDRFPVLIWAGAALLGWIAGEAIATDSFVVAYLVDNYTVALADRVVYVAGVAGVILVLTAGWLWRRRKFPAESEV